MGIKPSGPGANRPPPDEPPVMVQPIRYMMGLLLLDGEAARQVLAGEACSRATWPRGTSELMAVDRSSMLYDGTKVTLRNQPPSAPLWTQCSAVHTRFDFPGAARS
jgi:hypothetical protein